MASQIGHLGSLMLTSRLPPLPIIFARGEIGADPSLTPRQASSFSFWNCVLIGCSCSDRHQGRTMVAAPRPQYR